MGGGEWQGSGVGCGRAGAPQEWQCGLDHIQPETNRVQRPSALLLLLQAGACYEATFQNLPGYPSDLYFVGGKKGT